MDVSIILPIHNAEKWLNDCLKSVADQTFTGKMELSIYNDSSTDSSDEVLKTWIPKLKALNVKVVYRKHQHSDPKGVGYAKNRAVDESTGKFMCFLDADDIMHCNRVQKQYDVAVQKPNSIVGCKFNRVPEGSTERYTQWANNLKPFQLYTQIFTSHGPTIIMPTWFCSRAIFNEVGGFSEAGKGTPEDLLFFFSHLRNGGEVHRIDEDLLTYRYHLQATTFSVSEDTIWNIRVREFEDRILAKWQNFTIWNAGKQGRKLFRSLTSANQSKVTAFCDVDIKKITKGIYIHEESKEIPKPRIPIIHFTEGKPPFIICVKLGMTGGSFESNLTSLHLTEGEDYYHFN